MSLQSRRLALATLAGGTAVLAFAGCAPLAAASGWEAQLRGDARVLLGEVHDNAEVHRRRLAVLQRAFAAGWRPAIAMEQFDRERQSDIDAARGERPHDAAYLISRATAAGSGGWDWAFYRPVVELALRHDVPLLAANVSSADARRIVREGLASAFTPAEVAALGLDAVAPNALEAEQARAIEAGHCDALPASLVPAMVRAQFARDAVMAGLLRARRGGIVLLAGNGHVRRDVGVPRWLGRSPDPVLSVGFLEQGDSATPESAFDVVVRLPAFERRDPCARFRAPAAR